MKRIASGFAAVTIALGISFGTGSVAQAASGLCAATSSSADEEWITSLKLGTTSPINVGQGVMYKDASSSKLGTFQASTGSPIQLQVTVDTSQEVVGEEWQEYVFVWIDLNQDGKVDLQTEKVFAADQSTTAFTVVDQANPKVKTYIFNGNFSIPANAYNGTSVGRAMLQFVDPNNDPILCNSSPDAFEPGTTAFEFGSVVDFSIGVTGGVQKPKLGNTGTDSTQIYLVGSTGFLLLLVGVGATLVARRRNR